MRRRALAPLAAVVIGLTLSNVDVRAAAPTVIGVAAEKQGDGYWTVDRDGAVRSFDGAPRLGSAPARLSKPIVGIAGTPTGDGYWLVAADGGIFTFGDARYLGSTGATRLTRPIVGMAPTPTGRGYWLVAADGGIFTFGDARYLGSTGATRLTRPIVGMAPTPTGRGYWLAAADGGIFTFGDAPFLGSGTGTSTAGIVGLGATATGRGYWLFAADGRVVARGDAPDRGRVDGPVAAASADAGWVVVGPTGRVTERRDAPVVATAPDAPGAPGPLVEAAPTTVPPPALAGGGFGGGGGGGGSSAPPAPQVTTTTSTTTPAPVTTTTTTAPPTTLPATRVAARWPFAVTSPWNTPIGSAATFEPATGTRTTSLIDSTVTPWINAGQYSHPIYQASDTDPLATFHRAGYADLTYRVPVDARPAAGTDRHMHVVDPSGRWVDESWSTSGAIPDFTTGYHVRTDLTGPGVGQGGVRAYGGSAIGGLIRTWEVQQGSIRHAVAVALASRQLTVGPVWPATAQDGDAASTYSGRVPMGSLFAIPGNVDLTTQGLTADGLVLARALQDFGAYVVDRAGADVLYAEPSLDGTPALENLRRDVSKLRQLLRAVTDNSASSVGGGGVPRTSLAPPLA